jgi:hypothetical protein
MKNFLGFFLFLFLLAQIDSKYEEASVNYIMGTRNCTTLSGDNYTIDEYLEAINLQMKKRNDSSRNEFQLRIKKVKDDYPAMLQ